MMNNNSRSRKSTAKSNSPVSKTGQTSLLKKRLLRAGEENLLEGREKILVAARSCFARQGFAGTSIKDIQEESGFSRGNLYHHFKTKEDIVHTIIIQNLGRFCAQVDKTLAELKDRNLSLGDVIHELAFLAEQITKGPGRGMAFHVWSLAMVDPDIRTTMLACFENIRSALEAKIVALMTQGKIKKSKNTQELSVTLFGLVIPAFTVQSVFMEDKAVDSKQYAQCLEQIFTT